MALPFQQVGAAQPGSVSVSSSVEGASKSSDVYKLSLLIRSYQVRGHRLADLDPLGLLEKPHINDLDPTWYGFSEADMKKEIQLGEHKFISGFLAGSAGKRTLGDILERLRNTYSRYIGLEYMHIQEVAECNWIREHFETAEPISYDKTEKKVILDRLMWAEGFEKFLAKKWATAKRFGLEGGEALIPGVKALIDTAADLGVSNVIIGMPHRGRLVTLASVLRKPLESIFVEFEGKASVKGDNPLASGDVKYHLGTSYTRPTRGGKEIYLSLLANPSHLEAVNPCVMGKARAKQDTLGDATGDKVLPLLFHGDAAFAGQGIVYETMNFWELEGYKVGGTVHVIVNNQVGFTTDPVDARSSPYCTAVAKAAGAPIFHVNGDHPEEVVFCFQLAAKYRQKFHKDVVIDLVCYRRHGHNEMDPPQFTQPQMYDVINKHPTTFQQYSNRLVQEGVLTKEELDGMLGKMEGILEGAYDAAKTFTPKVGDWLSSRWEGFKGPQQLARIKDTGVSRETLKEIGLKLCKVPEGFTLHKNLATLLRNREQMFTANKPLDWATAELLAYGTLLVEGNRVRLSGQDVQRGTFTHRHCVVTDQKTGAKYSLLSNLSPKQAPFYAFNSPLSEFGVLGFELGYSGEDPNQLVIWEAQFGDFANSAQVIIDQFIASGEAKWLRQTGLTMLLPHGYDGQGPEHSSARLERYLQLVDSDPYTIPADLGKETSKQTQECNMQVVVPSTPANFFHMMRRQVHREFRKPLVCMSPKNLLRHPACVSNLSEMDDVEEVLEHKPWSTDLRFRRVIGETDVEVYNNSKAVKRVLFCSGKIYYELLEERTRRQLKNVAIIRIEQLAPFPFDLVQSNAAHYPNAEFFWVQEEPFNAGAYGFAAPHFTTALNGITPRYIGRRSAAATATGSAARHAVEQKELIHDAFEKPFRK